MNNADNMVLLGRISALFGIKGWVKVHSDTQPRENILQYSPWYLELDNQWVPLKVVTGQRHGKGLIAQLEGYADRDVSASLVGARIAIKRSQFPEAEADEYYWSDLQGLKVINLENIELGVITRMMETGANDVMVVRTEEGNQERLIPFVQETFVIDVNLDEGWIKVDWDLDWDLASDSDSERDDAN
ncbi:MAG: ribosome maturation factor RimM [Gammaproteobacteria bacterium]|nr:ribosome maturation factor RimM [Gammaproteobacteria bacterium]